MSGDIELLRIHLETIGTSINKLDNNVSRLFGKQDEMNVVLSRNTLIVEQHEARSTKLENIQINLNSALTEALNKLAQVEIKLKRLDDDVKPIKRHVQAIDKKFYFIKSIPFWIKLGSTVTVTIMSIMGGYYTYLQIIAKP